MSVRQQLKIVVHINHRMIYFISASFFGSDVTEKCFLPLSEFPKPTSRNYSRGISCLVKYQLLLIGFELRSYQRSCRSHVQTIRKCWLHLNKYMFMLRVDETSATSSTFSVLKCYPEHTSTVPCCPNSSILTCTKTLHHRKRAKQRIGDIMFHQLVKFWKQRQIQPVTPQRVPTELHGY